MLLVHVRMCSELLEIRAYCQAVAIRFAAVDYFHDAVAAKSWAEALVLHVQLEQLHCSGAYCWLCMPNCAVNRLNQTAMHIN